MRNGSSLPPWINVKLKAVLAKLGPNIHDDVCKDAVVDDAKYLFGTAAVINIIFDMQAPRKAFR